MLVLKILSIIFSIFIYAHVFNFIYEYYLFYNKSEYTFNVTRITLAIIPIINILFLIFIMNKSETFGIYVREQIKNQFGL